MQLASERDFQLHALRSTAPGGLTVRALPNGCLYSIETDRLLVGQVLASPVAGGVHRLYLRVHRAGGGIESAEIVGPGATGRFSPSPDRLAWSGTALGLSYRCTMCLHPDGRGLFVHLEVEAPSAAAAGAKSPVACDAILLQDVGLASRGQVRNNELFTAQYLDHHAVRDPSAGYVVLTRQNLPQADDSHPWLMQGCLPSARGFTTDGFDFFGVGFRGDGTPAALARPVIGERVRQYETAYVAVQSEQAAVAPGRGAAWTYFARFEPDHPARSSEQDLSRLKDVQAMRRQVEPILARDETPAESSLTRGVFQACDLLPVQDLPAAEVDRLFPQRRHEERVNGSLGSFFHGAGARHVVLRGKELSVARPHGHILRAGQGLSPDDELMACTCYAAGVFASQLTVGNISFGKLLSGVRDPLNLLRTSGLRVFVRDAAASGPWQLLGVPSAFEMALDEARWIYRRAGPDAKTITVRLAASQSAPEMTLEARSDGGAVELLVAGEIAAGPAEFETSPILSIDAPAGRITVRPDPDSMLAKAQPKLAFHVTVADPGTIDAIGGDELIYADARGRGMPYFAVRTRPTTSFACTFGGSIDGAAPPKPRRDDFWSEITAGASLSAAAGDADAPIRQVGDVLSWFARDAVVHMATPRGLEQPNGGAWGVRDVCQGPVEFLLSYGHAARVGDIVRRVFSQQYARRGDWPQWFMFPPFESVQSPHCHGDVLVWPLKALCDYLEDADDGAILREPLPYTDDQTFAPTPHRQPLVEHCDRLLRRVREQFLPGVSLPRYGDGDWDDSLQPADPQLRERMVSAWTSELLYQTLRRYAAALRRFGDAARAADADALADAISSDFQRHMVRDGVVAGFALFDAGRPVEYLLHPSDRRTGLKYRLIPMTRGILSGIFTPEQAQRHLDLLREHLLFPDGARLMDRPTAYEGGVERTFRRAESAAFFGREIGLQYVHAHLRYAEALAVLGRADELWRALLVVNPIAVTDVVPNARPRQRNTYFSSSDAAFADRYEASRDYPRLARGGVPVDAGWRIYSSGPGIYTSLVIRSLFGLRRYFDQVEFDPVLPRELDGATVELVEPDGKKVRYEFAVRSGGHSPRSLAVNGRAVGEARPHVNAYRTGGLRVPRSVWSSLLTRPLNHVGIEL